VGDYGEESTIQEFDKMKLCEYICGESPSTQKRVFLNLKETIQRLMEFFENNDDNAIL